MSASPPRRLHNVVWIALALGLALGGLTLSGQRSALRRRVDFADLQDRLQRHGVKVEVVSTRKDGQEADSVFLLAKDRGWNDLNVLSKNRARIEEWRGILYVERIGADPDVLVEQWGQNCMIAAPFILYGDPILLEQVRGALQDVNMEE
jgi:hypothetical protein